MCDHIVGVWCESTSAERSDEILAKLSELPAGRGHLDLDEEFVYCPLCGKLLD